MRCEKFACELPERDCLARQEIRGRAGGGTVRPTQFFCCSPSRCKQGVELRKKLEREGRLDEMLGTLRGRRR